MSDRDSAKVVVTLTQQQRQRLSPQQKKVLMSALKAAFIATTEPLGPEFTVSNEGPGVRCCGDQAEQNEQE